MKASWNVTPGNLAEVVRSLQARLEMPDAELAAALSQSMTRLQDLKRASATLDTNIIWAVESLAMRNGLDGLLSKNGWMVAPYDHNDSFWEQFDRGPRDGAGSLTDLPVRPTKFLGFELSFPIGVAACALTANAQFASYFAKRGYDLITYKTVRNRFWNPHEHPNWAFVPSFKGSIDPTSTQTVEAELDYWPPNKAEATAVNSFGVPSLEPASWQEDVARTKRMLGPGQVLVVSTMGNPEIADNDEELPAQFTEVSSLAKEAGADIVEVNLSCPNTGNNHLLCADAGLSSQIVKQVAAAISPTPLLIKIGYLERPQLEQLVQACAEYIDGIVAINTVAAKVENKGGSQFFPDSTYEGRVTPRERAGVSGHAVKDVGLRVVGELSDIRSSGGYQFALVGVGGVLSPQDFQDYISVGADAVQSCTGAWINPELARDIREEFGELQEGEADKRVEPAAAYARRIGSSERIETSEGIPAHLRLRALGVGIKEMLFHPFEDSRVTIDAEHGMVSVKRDRG